MLTCTTSKILTFNHPFCLRGVFASRRLQVVMDEERIERLSCPLYRRGSVMICLTAHSNSGDCRCFGPRDNAVSRGGNISSREIMLRQSQTRLVASRPLLRFPRRATIFRQLATMIR